jgi:hypothetical protein
MLARLVLLMGQMAALSSDEQGILDYLKAWPDAFVSAKEIARKVGGKERFNEDRGWALSILGQMLRYGMVETDGFGGYRLKLPEKKEEEEKEQHVSPQILNILKSSGKSFETLSVEDDKNESPIPPYRPRSKPPMPNDGTQGN